MNRTYTLSQIGEVARRWWEVVKGYHVFAFHGEMGAGKTTFIHALCDSKAVSTPVASPTFSLVNEYVYREAGEEHSIFHIDLYRIRDEEEAVQAGIEDCIYSGSVCFVEWPERAPGIFPEDTVHVFMQAKEDGLHEIKLLFPGGNQ